jgi:hypothetical protein
MSFFAQQIAEQKVALLLTNIHRKTQLYGGFWIPETLDTKTVSTSLSENTTKLLFCKNIDLYQHV